MKGARALALAPAALALLAGCDLGEAAAPRGAGTAAALPDDFVSGTRLRARVHVVEGLVRVFVTFHDSVLDVDCAYEDEGGAHVGPMASSYCLPAGMARHREGTGPFVDSACTVPAALPPQTGPASLVLVEPRDACTTPPVVFAALAPRTELAFLRDGTGACQRGQRVRMQRLGARQPEDTFVRAVEQIEPRPGRVDARVLVGDDGSRRIIGGFDRERSEATRIGMTEDGARRWVPVRTAFVGGGDVLFEDGTCAAPVATKIARTATCPLAAALVLEGNCGGGRYRALGERVALPFHRDEANACAALPAADSVAFRLGPAIPPSAFAPVASFEIGSSRLRRRGLGASGDQAVTWGELIDATTNEPCEVLETDDGSFRCLPAAAATVSFFADAACETPAFARATTGCELEAAPRFVHDTLVVPARAYAVGAELGAIYTLEAGRCVPFTPTVASRVFAVQEIATTTFPQATPLSE